MLRVLRQLSPMFQAKNLLLILLAPVLLVTGVTIFSYRNANLSTEAFASVTHTYNVINSLDTELSCLLGAESGVRGYVLTGREEFLQPYQAALEETPRRLASIRELTMDNPMQQANVARLEELTQQKIAHAKQNVELCRTAGYQSAANNIATGGGKVLMDQIRELMGQMKSEELRLLQIRQNESARYNSWVEKSCIGFFAGNLVVFAGMWFLIVRIGRMHNLVKVCSWTKRVEYEGKWMRFEEYLKIRFGIKTTHGLSREAAEQMKEELENQKTATKV